MKKDIWMDKELWSRIGDTAMKLDKALKGITKPQPLNLENIDEEIIEELNKRQPHDLQTEIDIFKEIIKQRLKSAVEGLKDELEDFKDKNPSLDTWVYSEILRMIDKWFKDEMIKNEA